MQLVLQTGNITTYPTTCSQATAAFSVLSDTIRLIQDVILHRRNRKDLGRLLGQLQSTEREKLHLTAALHLERIRQRPYQDDEDARSYHHDQTLDPRINQLLQEGIASLQNKIASCVETINEVLEELRMIMVEE